MPRFLRPLKRRIRMAILTDPGAKYSVWVGCIYIFNLIVGTGALALPKAFAAAGWALSTISLLILAFISYITVTYIVESMACANAVLKFKHSAALHRISMPGSDDEPHSSDAEQVQPLVDTAPPAHHYYVLDNRIELGGMANLFFSRSGQILFYATICIYLYGDLAIYAVAVSKTIMKCICSYRADEGLDWESKPCFDSTANSYTRRQMYHVALLVFTLVVGPFCFFNVQKTKYLQIFTTCLRWTAFTIMISIAISMLITHGAKGSPKAFDFSGLPTLFGSCVYAYMCHHSLPSLISPISGDEKLDKHVFYDYSIISIFYMLLAATGAFAFPKLYGIYTLNFVPEANAGTFLKIVEFYLALFPVFTLSTSFPIIGITLRNNLMNLFLDPKKADKYSFFVRRLLFPILTLGPPVVLTFFYANITVLIKFTGSYAGSGIQYLIPTFLVMQARKMCRNTIGPSAKNKFQSPFAHNYWAIAVIVWAVMCLVLMTVNLIETA